jgi:hypothetical protein
MVQESPTVVGDSPVGERRKLTIRFLSRTRHVKASLNPRGPSRKAKYSLATDSAPVARAKDEKNPDKGRNVNLKPHAYKRSEPYGRSSDWYRVTACLLHNDPATYRHGPG